MAQAAHTALEALLNDDSRRVSGAAAAVLTAKQSQPAVLAPPVKQVMPAPFIPVTSEVAVQAPDGHGAAQRPQVKSDAPSADVLLAHGLGSTIADYLHSPLSLITLCWWLGWMTSLLLALVLNNATALLYGWVITGVVGDLVLWWPRQGERLSNCHC